MWDAGTCQTWMLITHKVWQSKKPWSHVIKVRILTATLHSRKGRRQMAMFFWKMTSIWGSLQETSLDMKKPPFVDSRVLGKPWVLRIYVGLS